MTTNILEHYMTIEEAAEQLGRSRDSLYAITKRGRLRPIRIKRRNFFLRAEIAALGTALAMGNASKEESAALYARFPNNPTNDAGVPILPETTWNIYAAYASDPATTYESIGAAYHITRQRVQQHVAKAIKRLTELAEM